MNLLLEREMLDEMMGVWVYSSAISSVKTSHAQVAEYIYTYIREQLIEKYNENNSILSYQFEVPKELLKVDIELKKKDSNGNHLNMSNDLIHPLRIFYNLKNQNHIHMSTHYFVNSKQVTIEINRPFNDNYFKIDFIHELKHYWQRSFEHHDAFNDIVRHSNIRRNTRYPKDIEYFIDVVYHVNPSEIKAYTENIYTCAYDEYIKYAFDIDRNNYDDKEKLALKNKCIRKIKNSYCYADSDIQKMRQTAIDKNLHLNLQLYVCVLFLTSCPDYVEQQGYPIFSIDLICSEDAKLLYKKLKDAYPFSRISNNDNVNKILGNIAYEEVINNAEFVDKMIDDLINNVENILNSYKNKIHKVINMAFEDAQKSLEKNEKQSIDRTLLYRNILIYPKGYGIEVLFETLVDDELYRYIAIIKGNTVKNLYKKLYILYLKYNKKLNIRYIFESAYIPSNIYNFHNIWTKEKIRKLKLPRYNNYKSIKKIVEAINNLEL